MKMSKRTSTIILWAVSIGLLAGMIISFTPGASGIGGIGGSQGVAQMQVNGQTLYDTDVQQIRSNALFASVTEGQVGADLKRLMVDELVRQAVLNQAAARKNVSSGAVRKAVNEFREERGVAGGRNDQAYLQLIGSAGFDDQGFRDYLKQQLRIEAFENDLTKDLTVSDAEIEAYYQSHLGSYQTEERILGRQIVVDEQLLAQQLRKRVMDGESFAQLAADNSLELADRQGALGAPSGESEPRPVGRPAMPTNVANAAFALRGVGMTDVIESNERYFVVEVEEYLPAASRPFDEVSEQAATDALNAKRAGAVEAELDRLRDEAKLTFPANSELSFDNPVLAEVGGVPIRAVKLDRALYTNPQIQQSLSPQTADLIVGLFKPTVLSQLIDTEVAYQAADTLAVPFVGTRSGIAQAALDYVGRDASASEDELEAYYEAHLDSFTLPSEAAVTRLEFDTQTAASAFRTALLAGDDVAASAEAQGGTIDVLGLVKPGSLRTELDTALFQTDAFEPLPDGVLTVSDVLVLEELVEDNADATAVGTDDDADAETEADIDIEADADADSDADTEPAVTTRDVYVVLVADRTPARVRPLDDVRSQVEAAVLAEKRQVERTEWLAEQRANVDIEEFTSTDFNLGDDLLSPEGAGEGAIEEPGDATSGDEPDSSTDAESDDSGDAEPAAGGEGEATPESGE